MTPIVFLHIPKTAGQTIHHELQRVVGSDHVSPIRSRAQVKAGEAQMPPGYDLYSGHLDWTELESLPEDRFVFTVLRSPFERIASFYFYILKRAKSMSAADLAKSKRVGMQTVGTVSAPEYFFGGDAKWSNYIQQHYDNFYTRYFATRMIRGKLQSGETVADALPRALRNLEMVNRVYSTKNLSALEADIAERYRAQINLTSTFVNVGSHDRSQERWPMLLDLMDTDEQREKLTRLATTDLKLIEAIGLQV